MWEDDFWSSETEHTAVKLDVMTMGFETTGMTTSRAIQAHNFSYLVERMAASMTKAELDNSTTLVYGSMSSGVIQVDVAWYILVCPARGTQRSGDISAFRHRGPEPPPQDSAVEVIHPGAALSRPR